MHKSEIRNPKSEIKDMVFKDETIIIEHGTPTQVEIDQIEEALQAQWGKGAAESSRALARALTLVIYCDRDDPTPTLGKLIGEIITRNPARAIVVRAKPDAEPSGTEAWISTHLVLRADEGTQLSSEEIWLNARGEAVRDLHNTILSLRIGELPLAVWWRGQPDFDDPLFSELTKAGNQIILDSLRFTARAGRVNQIIGRLRREFTHVSFGDINWARLAAWREFIAQFFDNPAHLVYLNQLSRLEIDYATGEGGNPSQAILLLAWLAAQLNWKLVDGSYQRDGAHRSMRLRQDESELKAEIRGKADPNIPPGHLIDVRLSTETEPPVTFRVLREGKDSALTQIQIGRKVMDRSAMLEIPDEVSLVCYELDSPHRDRVYHRVLQFLEESLVE